MNRGGVGGWWCWLAEGRVSTLLYFTLLLCCFVCIFLINPIAAAMIERKCLWMDGWMDV